MRRAVRRGTTVRLRHIKKVGTRPSGNPRCYYSPPGGQRVPLPDLPIDSAAFLAAYQAAAAGHPVGTRPQHQTGTIGKAVRAFLASDAFLTRAASTRAQWRRQAERIERDYGRARLADLEPRHIRLDLDQVPPHPANNRLKLWRALCRWAVEAGLIDTDPARDVRKRATPASDGHEPWTAQDVARFRARWPVGTPQRLALELLHQTGAAIIDATRLGPGNLGADGWLTYQRSKSGTVCTAPLFVRPRPAFYPDSADLRACLDAAPRHMAWLVTASGASRSGKAAGQWFAAAARAAGIQGKTAHGVRKRLAIHMAEHGATEAQRMAILGHDTTAQTRHYSKAADARRIISGTDSGNFAYPVSKSGEK